MESLLANYASSDEEEEEQKQQQSRSFPSKPISLFSSLPHPHKNPVTNEQKEARNPTSNSSKSLIFSALPQPKSQPQQQLEKPTKRVVRFVPPPIKSNNKFDDDDDDDEDEDEKEREQKKRRESQYLGQGSSVKSFLSSIPAPKSSAVLGVGNSSGRRSIIVTEASAPSSSDVEKAVNNQSNYSNYYQTAETHAGYEVGNVDNLANYQTGSDDQNVGNCANYGTYQTGMDENVHSNYEAYNGYGDYGQYKTPRVAVSGKVLGKRGKNENPIEIVEVKQDELMKDRPREDQVKLTGIAFGPSYQPVSTKGKPSKLHKRKHQIGSLYFDMKQKETELAERRSRGLLTKSQTQGKYGW